VLNSRFALFIFMIYVKKLELVQVARLARYVRANHCVKVKGCPPKREDFIKAYKELGIELPDNPIKWMDELPGFFAGQYADRPEFDELFYKI